MKKYTNSVYLSALLKKNQYNRSYNSFGSAMQEANIAIRYIVNTNDLWLRDFMPIQAGEGRFVQFRLFPGYYKKHEKYLETDPAPICKKLGITPEIPLFRGKQIILDGGNVVKGFNKAIITEKVFKDNPGSREDLTEVLKTAIGVNKIIFIPPEPGERLGHSDGIARFLDEKTVLVNDYRIKEFDGVYSDKLLGALKNAGMDIQTVPYHPDMRRINGVEPATGCYINYYKIGDVIFLPTFDITAQDKSAISRFEELFGKGNVVPVPCTAIAQEGGALNCITWEIE